MRCAALCALAVAVLVVPAAVAAGPAISYVVTSGTPGDNGWYRSSVTAQIGVTGATDSTCPAVKTFRTSADTLSCTATDTTSTIQFTLQFKIDTDAPTVSGATTSRAPDRNVWFNHPFSVAFAGSDATSGIASCSSASYDGPDTSSGTITGTCRDNAGNVSASSTFAVKYDATPPQAAGATARAADANGWFNHAVGVTFSGSDATSGIDSCVGATTYAGPDNGNATVNGSCTDQAGNQAAASVSLKYDGTAPSLGGVAVTVGDRVATLTWKKPPDTTRVEVVRSPGRRGTRASAVYNGDATSFHDQGLQPGVAYRYTLTSRDVAGNRAVARVKAQLRVLYAPMPGARAHAGSVLRWAAVEQATYYNVQLFHNGRKVMSVWPVGETFRLPRAWAYHDRPFRLSRGTYRWYVWPGLGARADARYGRMLGGSFFRIA